MDNLVTLISSLGFPIAACIAMGWYMVRKMDAMEERHKEEVDKLAEAVNNNTLVMTRLVERMGGDG